MRIARCALLLIGLALPINAAPVAYLRLDPGIVAERLKQKPTDAQARLQMLRRQFREAGCDPKISFEQTVKGEDLPNLVCIVPGSVKETMIFTADLDYKESEDESGSKWATVAMLPLMAESLNSTSHRCTYIFIALTGRSGQRGAWAYLESLPESSKRNIVAVTDLEQLGWKPRYAFAGLPPKQALRVGRRTTVDIAADHEETPLSQSLLAAADTLKMARPEAWRSEAPSNNTGPFESSRIASLIVASPDYLQLEKFDGTAARVQQKKIDHNAYYETYNLLVVYALHLDQTFGGERGKLGQQSLAEQQITERLFAVINRMRASVRLPALVSDPRVANDAQQQAQAFAANKRAEEEADIEQRLAKVGVPVAVASEVWFVLPEGALRNDGLIREAISEQTRASLLDPQFTVAGVAAVHRGNSYFAVANLIAGMQELTAEEAETAVINAIGDARTKIGLHPFTSMTASAQLRERACSMAKQDSLQSATEGVIGRKVFAFASVNPAASDWIGRIAAYGQDLGLKSDEKFVSVKVGICRAVSPTYPAGTYWSVVEVGAAQ